MMQYPYIDGDDLISKFIFKWINHNNSSHFWAFTLCQIHNDIHYLWSICAKHFKYITSLKSYKTKDRSYYCLHITAKSLDKSSVLLKVIQVISGQERSSLSLPLCLTPKSMYVPCYLLPNLLWRGGGGIFMPRWKWQAVDVREGQGKERNRGQISNLCETHVTLMGWNYNLPFVRGSKASVQLRDSSQWAREVEVQSHRSSPFEALLSPSVCPNVNPAALFRSQAL